MVEMHTLGEMDGELVETVQVLDKQENGELKEVHTHTQSGIAGALKHGGTKRNLNAQSGSRGGGGLSIVR